MLFVIVSASALHSKHENIDRVKDADKGSRDSNANYGELLIGTFLSTQSITINVPFDYSTIQEGIDVAEYGDIVLVATGIYTEHINMKSGIALVCDDIERKCVISEDSLPTIDSALITCENCDEHTLIEGFTVTGTNGHIDAYGYGIILINSDARITNNNIINNYSRNYSGPNLISYSGQGIWIYGGGKPKIIGNFISNNRTYRFGGGVSVASDSGAIIIGNIFKSNRVFNWGPDCDGGGLAIGSNNVFVSNNVFDGNIASGNDERGGGIYIESGLTPEYIGNNIFVNNIPFAVESDDYRELSYNLFHKNSEAVPALGMGNIFTDPQFITDTYHLDVDSPAIDSGDPTPVFNDPEEPNNPGYVLYPALGGLRNDMGAYGDGTDTLCQYANHKIIDVTINGPTTGITQTSYTFIAEVTAITTAQPITYVWQATGIAPITQTNGLTDEIDLAWPTYGTKRITVTAINAVGSISDSHTICIIKCEIYLPLIIKMPGD